MMKTRRKAKVTKSMFVRRRILGRLAIILFGIAVLAASPGRGHAAGTEDASAFLASLTDRAFAQLSDESLSMPERRQRFRVLFRDNFDVPAIGRFVLGRYWRKATEAERAEYGRLFEDLIVATYSRQLSSYAGETLKVEGVRQQDGKSALVASRFLRAVGEPIQLDWRLLRRGDTWRIVDVVVEGMSMALSQRSEFKAVIRGNGGRVEALLEKLREKTRQAESGSVQKADSTE